MKKLFAALVFFAAATPLFAHAGHVHTHMGTVTALHGESAFVVKTTDGKDLTIEISSKTTWTHADGRVARQSELAIGDRVVVKMAIDDRTAASVKMSEPARK